MPRGRDSEVHAYGFIKENLKELGWDVRNPNRHPSGQVYTQNECLAHDQIQVCLGLDKPENVIKVSDSIFWVIEAKPQHKDITVAVNEAEDYAAKINASKHIKALFISGVAGNPTDSYLVQTRFWDGKKFRAITINGRDISSLLSPEIAQTILSSGPAIKDVPVDEKLFLTKAEKINKILHKGAINTNMRARVMAALLLALVEDTQPNVDAPPSVLISEINARAKRILTQHKKPEFFNNIQISLPSTEDNHIKFKTALVQTIQELNNLNIRSAMNSGTDVLGKFYEVFLKYGNGAKEIGIVLTPRHITKFAVDVLGITDRDVVYDPTCGTGGFLVAAFDEVKDNFATSSVNRFKQKNLFGVDQDTEVVSLAIVNMIFRGDGKNNIVEGNALAKFLVQTDDGIKYVNRLAREDELAVTRVLMNPPFASPGVEKEYKFVDQALRQMQRGALLFSVLPYSAMVRGGGYQDWRTLSLLGNNTLLSVVTFPDDLFYPVGVHALGIFVKKGIPHPKKQNVLWLRAINDGLLKRKGRRLVNPRAKNDFPRITPTLEAFVRNQELIVPNEPRFQKACPIDFTDPLLELVPENYLDEPQPTASSIREGIEKIVRGTAAFLIQERKENEFEAKSQKAGRSVRGQVGRLPFNAGT